MLDEPLSLFSLWHPQFSLLYDRFFFWPKGPLLGFHQHTLSFQQHLSGPKRMWYGPVAPPPPPVFSTTVYDLAASDGLGYRSCRVSVTHHHPPWPRYKTDNEAWVTNHASSFSPCRRDISQCNTERDQAVTSPVHTVVTHTHTHTNGDTPTYMAQCSQSKASLAHA